MERQDEGSTGLLPPDQDVHTILDRAERRRRGQHVLIVLGVCAVVAVAASAVVFAMRRPEAKAPQRPAAKYEPIPLTEDTPAPAENSVPAPAAVPTQTPAATLPPAATPTPAPTPAAPGPTTAPAAPKPAPRLAAQRLTIRIGEAGYEPSVVVAAADAPITLTVGKGEGCAAGFLMPSLGVEKDNSAGDVTFSLGTLKAGTYKFTCGMEMIEGSLVVR